MDSARAMNLLVALCLLLRPLCRVPDVLIKWSIWCFFRNSFDSLLTMVPLIEWTIEGEEHLEMKSGCLSKAMTLSTCLWIVWWWFADRQRQKVHPFGLGRSILIFFRLNWWCVLLLALGQNCWPPWQLDQGDRRYVFLPAADEKKRAAWVCGESLRSTYQWLCFFFTNACIFEFLKQSNSQFGDHCNGDLWWKLWGHWKCGEAWSHQTLVARSSFTTSLAIPL